MTEVASYEGSSDTDGIIFQRLSPEKEELKVVKGKGMILGLEWIKGGKKYEK